MRIGSLSSLLTLDLDKLTDAGVRVVIDSTVPKPVLYDPAAITILLWELREDVRVQPAMLGTLISYSRYVLVGVQPTGAAQIGA